MAKAVLHALLMSPEEQRNRMRLMRDLVRERNVYRWAAQMLLDAARLRRHRRISQLSVAGEDRTHLQASVPQVQRKSVVPIRAAKAYDDQ